MDVEVFRLNEKQHWKLKEYNKKNAAIQIKAIAESVTVSEIYDGLNL